MYVWKKTCKCFFFLIYPNVQLFFVDLCSMPCLSENCNAKETKTDDLKVVFNHILSSRCLFWDLTCLLFTCLFSHFLFLLSENGYISFLLARQTVFYFSFIPVYSGLCSPSAPQAPETKQVSNILVLTKCIIQL